MARPRNAQIEGWIRQLTGDRLEIFLKAEKLGGQPDRKIRASGAAAEMLELVEWFEEKTGLHVSSPILPRRAPTPFAGQLGLELTDKGELESEEEAAV